MTLKTVPDLFSRFRARETGHWRVGGEQSRTVYLDSGDIVYASSNFPSDRLTTIVVEQGKLTADQMSHALSNLKPGISVAKNLIEMGFITQRDLLDIARLQVERIACSALLSPQTPTFEAREDLEDSIVRLPIDTPSLLFKGVMNVIDDRENLLELLGPLNQVVIMQSKRIFDIGLPDDLAKIARIMDGTRTILELSNEAGVQPIRTGALALFLREMGWGRLYELPPLDRQAISRALETPDPTKPPHSIPSQDSKLFELIKRSEQPTTSLDQLSDILDDIQTMDSFEDLEDPPPSLKRETPPPGPVAPLPLPTDAEMPSPNKSIGRVLPFYPSEPEPTNQPDIPPEPSIKISRDEPRQEDEDNSDDQPDEKKGVKKLMLALLAILVVLALTVAYSVWKFKNRTIDPPFTIETSLDLQGPDPAPPEQGAASPVTPPPAAQAETIPTQQTQPTDLPQTSSTADISKEARFRAIADGNMVLALEQGRAFQSDLPRTAWTIRLIVALQVDTIQYCAQTLAPSQPELFLRPIRLRDGRNSYQLFVGR